MIRRVLSAVINADHPQIGVAHAFDGVFRISNVRHFDYLAMQRDGTPVETINQSFRDVASMWKPDWIWLQLQDTNVITAETLRQVRQDHPRCVVTHWTGDARPTISPYLGSICAATHMTLASSVGQLEAFRQAGAPKARYLQIGLDWQEDVLGEPDWTPPFRVPDVVFIGGYYGDVFPGTVQRVDAVQALLEAGIDIGIVGSGWPSGPYLGVCTVKQQHHVWKRAKVALSVNHFNDLEQYYSDRQLISMASGTPVVCHYVPGMSREFQNGVHCCWYRGSDELVGHVQRLLASPEMRARIGQAGRAEVIRRHTWFSRIMDVLPEIETIQKELSG